MNEQLAGALQLYSSVNLVTILIKLPQIDSPLLLLFTPADPAPTAEAATEHQCPETHQPDQWEETGLQRPSSRGVHHHQGSNDSH
jgi:hypothetical protein